MKLKIDLTRGGYRGDVVEETFKPFSAQYMPSWWHFREVLRANHAASPWWKKTEGTAISDDEQRELVGLSLLNYAVYTGMAEAVAFLEQIGCELSRTTVPGWRLFEVRRVWKAMYSSLNTSFNALSNIVCIVAGQKPVLRKKAGTVWNYSPKDALNLVEGQGLKDLLDPLRRCKDRLQIREHLDHYWLIWHSIVRGKFLLDKNFEKGYAPIHPDAEVSADVDAYQLATEHVVGCATDFDLIYGELAIKGGYLDQYVSAKGWEIDYSDYGPPHSGQHPSP